MNNYLNTEEEKKKNPNEIINPFVNSELDNQTKTQQASQTEIKNPFVNSELQPERKRQPAAAQNEMPTISGPVPVIKGQEPPPTIVPREIENPFVNSKDFPQQDNMGMSVTREPTKTEEGKSSIFAPLAKFHEKVAKPTGNFVLDTLSYLDRPRSAVGVAMKEAATGGSAIEGLRKGMLGKETVTTRNLLPDWFQKEYPGLSKLIGFTGDTLTDPLTYFGGAVGKGVTGGAMAAGKKIAPGAGRLLDNEVAKVFNIYTGDLKRFKELQDKYRNLAAFKKHEAVREAKIWDKQLRDLANDLNIEPTELKKQIITGVEAPKKLELHPRVLAEADRLRALNSEQLRIEQSLGIPTGELGNYFHHAITPEGKKLLRKENIKQIFRINKADHPATKIRRLEGTIEEINQERPGFFSEDPVIAQTIRNVMHTDATTSAQFLQHAAMDLAGNGADMIETSIPMLKGMKFDPDVARELEKVHRIIIQPPEAKAVVETYDKIQNWWKMWSLGARPAYHARNVVGNFWNNYLGDVTNPLVYGKAANLQRQAAKGIFNGRIAGKDTAELYRAAGERGLINKGQYGADIMTEVMDELEKSLSKTKAWDFITPSTHNKFLRWGFALGHGLEDNARLAHFIDKVEKGWSYDQAANSAKKYLFDYGDLSDVEKGIFKRVVPFYTWTRKNLPLQLQSLVMKPQKFQKINLMKNQLQAGVDQPDPQNAPDFIKDAGPIYYGETEDEDKKAITLMGYLPAMDLQRLADPKNLITQMISPFLKEPIEQIWNWDTYRQEALQKYEGETADIVGIKVPVRLAHLARNLVMLNEIDRANPFGIFGLNYVDPKTGDRIITHAYGMKEERGNASFGIGATRETRTDMPGMDRLLQYAAGLRPYLIDEQFEQFKNIASVKNDVQELLGYLRKAKGREQERKAKEIERVLNKVLEGAQDLQNQ